VLAGRYVLAEGTVGGKLGWGGADNSDTGEPETIIPAALNPRPRLGTGGAVAAGSAVAAVAAGSAVAAVAAGGNVHFFSSASSCVRRSAGGVPLRHISIPVIKSDTVIILLSKSPMSFLIVIYRSDESGAARA